MNWTKTRTFAAGVALMALSMQVHAQACLDATPGTYQWQNSGFANQTGNFSIMVSARPQTANGDMLVGLSQGAKTNWAGLAAIVRFNRDNMIDVRDGGSYRTVGGAYYPGRQQFLRFDVDVPNHRYSVYHKESGDYSWYRLAYNVAFRTEQQSVTSLNNFVAEAEIGNLNACVQDPETWKTATPGAQQWQNAPLGRMGVPATNTFRFYVRPGAAGSDALIALSNGPKTNWAGLAAIVRFNRNNTIDVRNGGTYMADNVVTYLPNETYKVDMHVRLPFENIPASYSVWVTPPTGQAVEIARSYAFRTEQQNVNNLTNWVTEAEIGRISAHLYHQEFE